MKKIRILAGALALAVLACAGCGKKVPSAPAALNDTGAGEQLHPGADLQKLQLHPAL